MKTAKSDRKSVINRNDSICVSMCERDREIIRQKAQESGLSMSSYVRMVLKGHIAKMEN